MRRAILAIVLALSSGVAVAGYDVHISRKANWFDDSGPRITLLEWQGYVRSDPQVQKDPLNTINDFEVTLSDGSFPLWFDPDAGELYTKDPSNSALAKMVEIAKKLHARVQGDDGELYPVGH